MGDANTYFCPLREASSEDADSTHTFFGVVSASNVVLEEESDWDLLNIPPSGELTSIQAYRWIFIIRAKCKGFSIEVPTSTAGLFQCAEKCSNTLGEQQKPVGIRGPDVR